METEGSVPFSQETATFSYPEPDYSSPRPPILFFQIYFNIIIKSAPISPPKACVHLSSAPYVLRAPSSLFLILITRVMFSKEHRSWSSSLCSLPRSPVTSSYLDPNIFLSTPFSDAFNICYSVIQAMLHTLMKNRQNYSSVYFNLYVFGQQRGGKIFCTEW